jgi:hypothetical protein
MYAPFSIPDNSDIKNATNNISEEYSFPFFYKEHRQNENTVQE